MHACLLPIVALVFCLPVVSADDSCACYFPTQMRGEMAIYIEDGEDIFDLLQPTYSNFEVDFDAERVRIWPSGNDIKGNSEYIQDLKNNIMYRFPFQDDGTKGPCTYIKLTEDIRFPNCLPAEWFIVDTDQGDNIFSDSEDSYYNEYYMRANDLCQPVDIYHERSRNATTFVKIDVEVMGYKLSTFLNGTLDSSCTEASFDSFLKKEEYK